VSKYRCRCTRLGCGNRIKDRDNIPKRISAKCKGVYGLGDLMEWCLRSVGITKQRWSKWSGQPCGSKGGCGKVLINGPCDRRQEKLIALSDRVAQSWNK